MDVDRDRSLICKNDYDRSIKMLSESLNHLLPRAHFVSDFNCLIQYFFVLDGNWLHVGWLFLAFVSGDWGNNKTSITQKNTTRAKPWRSLECQTTNVIRTLF